MAKGRNLKTSSKDEKALKQEKILKKLEEKLDAYEKQAEKKDP